MPELSRSSRLVLGLSLILIPTHGYHENALHKALFWAGHTHAGVLTILALVGIPLMDSTALPESLVRWSHITTPLLVSAGFFLSLLPLRAERSGPLIMLLYVGILTSSFSTLVLGFGLRRSH